MLNVCEIATVFKIYKVYEIYKVAKLRKVGYSYTTENTPSKIHTFEKYIFDKYSLNKSKSDVSKNTSLRECYLKSRYFSVSRPLPKSHKAMDIVRAGGGGTENLSISGQIWNQCQWHSNPMDLIRVHL